MPQVHYHPDNHVAIRDNGNVYLDTVENFEADYGKPFPLPDGITEVIYEPEVRHALIANNTVIDGGEMPWLEGDNMLAAIHVLLDAQSIRHEAKEAAKIKEAKDKEAEYKAESEKNLKKQQDEVDKKQAALEIQILRRQEEEAEKFAKAQDALAKQLRDAPVYPTLDDVLAVLTSQQQATIQDRVKARERNKTK